MEKVVKSKIKVYYSGRIETGPFNVKQVLKNADNYDKDGLCEKGIERENLNLKMKIQEHEKCCEKCKKTIASYKQAMMYRKIQGISVPMEIKHYYDKDNQLIRDDIDFVQSEAGYNHSLLLSSRGQVFSFGNGLRGQLGLGLQKLHQDYPMLIDFPQIYKKGSLYAKHDPNITRIQANSFDSAAFDDTNQKLFTWGSFGNLRMRNTKKNQKWVQFSPKEAEIHLMVDRQNRQLLIAPDEQGKMEKNSMVKSLRYIENITIVALDWGANHMVIVDSKHRVYTMGQNRYGKLGDGEINLEPESGDLSSQQEEEEEPRMSAINSLSSLENIKKSLSQVSSKKSLLEKKRKSRKLIDPIGAMVEKQQKNKDTPYERKSTLAHLDLQDKWTPLPSMIDNFADPGDKVASVQCGMGHTIAVTKQGCVFSWGEGFEGKLGQGLSKSTRLCKNFNYPKKIVKGFPESRQMEKEKDAVSVAGCGKNMNVVVLLQGKVYSWGKGEYNKLKYDDLKTFSRPRQICEKIQIQTASVGFDHCILKSKVGQLWGLGENTNGCLGTFDTKKRINAAPIHFFDDKRIIDFSCGDRFSIFITECYEDIQSPSPAKKMKIRKEEQKIQSAKMDIKSTRQSICGGGYGSIPKELKTKIETMLTQRTMRRDASVDHAKRRSLKRMIENKANEDPYGYNETAPSPNLHIKNKYSLPVITNHNRQISGILLNRNVANSPLKIQTQKLQISNMDLSSVNQTDRNMGNQSSGIHQWQQPETIQEDRSIRSRSKSNNSSVHWGSESSNRSLHSTKSRYLLPSLNKKQSNMNPSLRNILVRASSSKSLKSSGTPEFKNDLINKQTIDQYIQNAFKIAELKEKMKIYRRQKKIEKQEAMLQEQLEKQEKLQREALFAQYNQRKESRKKGSEIFSQELSATLAAKIQTQTVKVEPSSMNVSGIKFAEDFFSSDQTFEETDELNDAQKAKKHFKEQWESPEGRKRIYKDILQKGYPDYFTNGFSVSKLNEQFTFLPKEDKTVIIQGVLDSLNLDLKKYSSPRRKKRYLEMKQKEEEILRVLNPQPKKDKKDKRVVIKSVPMIDESSELSFKVHKKQALVNAYGQTKEEELLENDLSRVTLYNPYHSRVNPITIERKHHISVSGSLSSKRITPTLFIGGKYLRKISKDEAIKRRAAQYK